MTGNGCTETKRAAWRANDGHIAKECHKERAQRSETSKTGFALKNHISTTSRFRKRNTKVAETTNRQWGAQLLVQEQHCAEKQRRAKFTASHRGSKAGKSTYDEQEEEAGRSAELPASQSAHTPRPGAQTRDQGKTQRHYPDAAGQTRIPLRLKCTRGGATRVNGLKLG